MNISPHIISLFRDDLCKDERLLEVLDCGYMNEDGQPQKILRKHSTSLAEHINERSVIEFLLSNGMSGIPRFIERESGKCHYVDMEYYEGIRILNILAYLRELAVEMPEKKSYIGEINALLVQRCESRQKEIHRLLMEWRKTQSKREPYPKQKLTSIVCLLTTVMNLSIDKRKIYDELDSLYEMFVKIADTPFRDAVARNILLNIPELHLDHFYSKTDNKCIMGANSERKKVVRDAIISGKIERYANAPLVDFDFATCEHDTTIYDDAIGFHCHEINWHGIPTAEKVCWDSNCKINEKDIAISFIVRYLRFGGRKLAYRIILPGAHKLRFYYDDGTFYFKHLNAILDNFWPNSRLAIPELRKFNDAICRYDISKAFNDEYQPHHTLFSDRKFYLDVYPN